MARTTRQLDSPNGAETEITDAPTDSIELSINAKGACQWTIKAYGDTPAEIAAKLHELRTIAERHANEIAPKGA